MDLDGTHAALVGGKQNGLGSRVALIDLASAAVTGCKTCTSFLPIAQGPYAPELRWVGDGLLLTTRGEVLNWELGMGVAQYGSKPLDATGYRPDRRLWGVGAGPAAAAAAGARGEGPQQFLTALTVPHPDDVGGLTRSLGLPFAPGTPLRVAASGPGGAGRYEAIAEATAKALAAAGYPIDPDAKVGVRVVVTQAVAEQKTVEDPDRRITPADRDRYQRANGSMTNNQILVGVKRITGLRGVGKVQAFDESGQAVSDLVDIMVETNNEDQDAFDNAISYQARLVADREEVQKRRRNGDARFTSGAGPHPDIDGVAPEKK